MSLEDSRLRADLIERAQAGHRSALGLLFQEHSHFLLGIITRMMGPGLRRTLEPEDVLQETLLVAAVHFENFHGSKDRELRTWLAALAWRKLVDLARHNKRLKRAIKLNISLDDPSTSRGESLAAELPADPCTASQVVGSRELADRLTAALSQIDPREAAVLRMRYAEGLSLEAIGRRIGIGRNGVSGIVARGLCNLRGLLPQG